ncbi:hypothetical protein BegalDRAFT_3378 [Beggiatoa alba B18LD]|uniref:Lipoprotein n=1 Tax=Beggiatoa alba B18LD TaxID=395493 RepID=I3CKQ3_9GAMM|nr:hypothetical protein [Beggiatoa alba]EIJ44196.1 hypothetical protein BegalDRAFT_3378 [Beggiatoa alba B18LD]
MKRLINLITLSVTVGCATGCSIVVPFLDKSWVDNPSYESGKIMQPLTVSSELANNNASQHISTSSSTTNKKTPATSTATTAPVITPKLAEPKPTLAPHTTTKPNTSPNARVETAEPDSIDTTDENLTETPLEQPITLEPLGTAKKGGLGSGGFKTPSP